MVTKIYNFDDIKKIFSTRLKQLRKDNKDKFKTQYDFAEAMDVSVETVRNWEQGRSFPEMEKLCQMCELLGCDLDFLVGSIDKQTHSRQFICDQTGLTERAVEKIMIWNEDSASETLDSALWVQFLSDMISDDAAGIFFDRLHYGIINESSSRPTGEESYIPQFQIAAYHAHHDATISKLSRIMSDIIERVLDKRVYDI